MEEKKFACEGMFVSLQIKLNDLMDESGLPTATDPQEREKEIEELRKQREKGIRKLREHRKKGVRKLRKHHKKGINELQEQRENGINELQEQRENGINELQEKLKGILDLDFETCAELFDMSLFVCLVDKDKDKTYRKTRKAAARLSEKSEQSRLNNGAVSYTEFT